MSNIETLKNRFLQGRLTRREFLAQVSALGLAATLSPALLGTPARAATPKSGGRCRIAYNDCGMSDGLDPTISNSNCSGLLRGQLANPLVEEGPGGVLIPELAESWESSKDVKKWTFKLRKGIEFHNGKTFDVEDAIYSLASHRHEGTKSQAKAYLADVQEMKADGKYTLVITLSQGNVDFPTILAFPSLLMVPAGTTDYTNFIGTGPYTLKLFEPGVRSLTQKNPNYWKDDRGHFDEVEILGIADVNARINALRTGVIDVMNECDLKSLHLLEKDPKVQVIRVTAKKHHLFPMRTDQAPYDNNDVRLALKYAIDREEIVNKVLNGYGTVGNDHPIGPAYRFHATEAELPRRAYDPDKARYHLKKAGLEGHTFNLHVADAPYAGAVDTALLYQQHAVKAGVNLKVVREPDDGYWTNVWMKKPFCASKWSGRLNEDMMFSTAYSSGAPWNETFWNNEDFNRLLKAARTEIDENKRREMYVDMQRLVRDEGGSVIPVFGDFVYAASSKIRYGELSSSWELDGLRAPERWWFES